MIPPIGRRRFRVLLVLNIVLIGGALFAAEFVVRARESGFSGAVKSFLRGDDVPLSDNNSWLISDPDIGYRHRPDRKGINAYGFRGPVPAVPLPGDMRRILVLGDSLGWDSPSFAEFLRDRLTADTTVQVLNTSCPGYTTYQERIFLEKFARPLADDLVIVAYCLNDNHRILHRFQNNNMLMTDEAAASLSIDSAWEALMVKSHLLRNLRIRRHERARASERKYPWQGSPDFGNAWKAHTWSFQKGELKKIKELVESTGGQLAIVVFPVEPQLSYLRSEPEVTSYVFFPQDRLFEIGRALDIPVLDLRDVFTKTPDRKFRDGIHMTPAGHQVAAEAMEPWVRGLLAGRSGKETTRRRL